MKVLKIVAFIALVGYWISTMNDTVKGEGLFGSFLGILVLIVFIYGAYTLFFNSSQKANNEITESVNPAIYNKKDEEDEDYDDEDYDDDDDDDDEEDEDDEDEDDYDYYDYDYDVDENN